MDKFNKLLAAGEPMVLSIFQIITGLLLFQYGVAKLLKFPAVPMFEKVQALSLYGAAGMFELIFGGLLILGLFSRLAAVFLWGGKGVSLFFRRTPDPRSVLAARGVYPVRRNGVRLFHRAFSKGLHPAAECRQSRNHAVFCLPLPRLRRRRAVEPRCDDARQALINTVIPGWSEGPDLRCAIAHLRMRRLAQARNDGK